MFTLLAVMLYGSRIGGQNEKEFSYFAGYNAGDDKMLDNYCIDKSSFVNLGEYKKIDQDARDKIIADRQELLTKTIGELMAYLGQARGEEEIGDRLYLIGLKYAQGGDLSVTNKYWSCAAEKYMEPKSMLKIAKLYFVGDKTVGIVKDYKKAYFWLLNAIYVDIAQGERNNVWSNSGDFVSEMESGDKYGIDYVGVAADSLEFIKKVYPDIEVRIENARNDEANVK